MSELTRSQIGPYLGTCSWGTLRPIDLAPRFVNLFTDLAHLAGFTQEAIDFQSRLHDLTFEVAEEDLDEEALSELVNEVQDRIDYLLPRAFFFGPSEGDGSDFGIWEDDEAPDMEDEVLHDGREDFGSDQDRFGHWSDD